MCARSVVPSAFSAFSQLATVLEERNKGGHLTGAGCWTLARRTVLGLSAYEPQREHHPCEGKGPLSYDLPAWAALVE